MHIEKYVFIEHVKYVLLFRCCIKVCTIQSKLMIFSLAVIKTNSNCYIKIIFLNISICNVHLCEFVSKLSQPHFKKSDNKKILHRVIMSIKAFLKHLGKYPTNKEYTNIRYN